jgi:hypothetical protein
MKLFIVMISLLTFAACSDSQRTKSKSCTFNNGPIDCSILEGRSSDADSINSELGLEADVMSDIRIWDNTIEALY